VLPQSQERLAKRAARYDLNPKTVANWQTRPYVHDAPMGPKQPHSTVLPKAEEALMVTCRRQTLLPLDDGLSAWPSPMPHLTRSALHRCVQRHGSSRLPAIEGDTPQKKTFKRSPIGDFPRDMAEVRPAAGTLALGVAMDRACQCVSAERYTDANTRGAAQVRRNLRAAIPDKIHTVLTDHGIPFTNRKRDRYALHHLCDRVCPAHGIDHRLTTTHHPWTNGQVERMNRTLKEATVRTYDDETHDHLKEHVYAFLMAYHFATRLKTLTGLTPYEYICPYWQKDPERWTMKPCHHTLGLNMYSPGKPIGSRRGLRHRWNQETIP
jgi:transposase InsO family protein